MNSTAYASVTRSILTITKLVHGHAITNNLIRMAVTKQIIVGVTNIGMIRELILKILDAPFLFLSTYYSPRL